MMVDWRKRLNVDVRTRLLLEFRLVWFEHTNLAPAIEEQHDGTSPDHQHEANDYHLMGSDN